jgi:diaminopimelate decarboxylase
MDRGMTAPTPAVLDRVRSLSSQQLPAYIYDLAALREHVAAVRNALPDRVELYYAAKANPEPAILATLDPYVTGFEVSSGGELEHVREVAPARPVAFGGPGKTPAEIATALELDVERIHVESAGELHMLAGMAGPSGPAGQSGRSRPAGQSGRPPPDAPVAVLLRFNLPVPAALWTGAPGHDTLAMGGRPTPFGIDPALAGEVLRPFTDGGCPHLRLRGVHAHLASGLEAPELLAVAESVVAWTVELTGHTGVRLAEVNVGGGMAVDYGAPERRFDWPAYGAGLARLAAAHPDLTLRVEPGRALTAYCGWYVTEVLDVKHSYGEEFAVVRGGTHHMRTPAAKGHDQPCTIVPCERPWPHPWPRPAARQRHVTLTGQLCTPKDVLARHVPAPGLRAGDRVAFCLAGAYAWNISHHDFLMHPWPGRHFLAETPAERG